MAQSISGTHLDTTWNSGNRRVAVTLEIQWDGSNWTDESAYLQSFEISAGLIDESTRLPNMGQARPAAATITLDNYTNRFSRYNSSSAIYSHIQYGIQRVPIRLGVQIDYGGSWEPASPLRQFTGYVESISDSHGGGDAPGKTVTLTCTDPSLVFDQYKHTSTLSTDQRIDEVLSSLLTDVGIGSTDLDRGLNIIPYVWLDAENVLAQCQLLAASEAGAFYFSKEGIALFRRMTSLLTDGAVSQATYAPARIFNLAGQGGWRDCYTGTLVEYTPRAPGEADTIYTSLEIIELAPSETKDLEAAFTTPVTGIVTPVAETDYQAVTAGFTDLNSSLTISFPAGTTFCQRATIRLANAHASQRMFVPKLQLRGYPLEGLRAQEVTADAASGVLTNYWRGAAADTKRYEVRNNPFIQTEAQASMLAQFLRDRLSYPRDLWNFRGSACPYLELGDRITVQDNSGTPNAGINADAYVVNMRQRYSQGQNYEMELTVLPVANVYAYTGYFVLGTSAWGASTDELFY